ncbi:MAG: sn-glycerol-3-phosphate ABC transporter ATP-binding protein UgpC [Geminicoccaceae bacterium]|nr:MAG: sn-glycerol-3-phosphate ABC transporter ATP-binding protein UgpC [Geminicoccaceae bacterium]
MADLSLRRVDKTFGDVEVIKGVDLDIASGEFVVFVGPSGCGKSTLLRLVAGLEDITAGELWIGGQLVNDEPPSRRGIAMVFQSYALYPHMTVWQNMSFGLKLQGMTRAQRDEKVKEAARILQIDHLLDRKPRQLSGGQRQRVAIGRAIVRQPRVFLFDEPLSNLDAALRVQTRIEIAKLHRAMQATMIYVTHDQVEAMTLADKIVVLNAGRVEQVGSPMDLYHRPANKFVAAFIGSPTMNFLPVEFAGSDGATLDLRLASGAIVQIAAPKGRLRGHRFTLGLRPEHLHVLSDAAPLRGEAAAVENLGGESYLYVDIGQPMPLVVKAPGDCAIRAGEPVGIGLPASKGAYLFDQQDRAVASA